MLDERNISVVPESSAVVVLTDDGVPVAKLQTISDMAECILVSLMVAVVRKVGDLEPLLLKV